MKNSQGEESVRRIAVRVYTRYEGRKIHARVHVVGETHVAQGGKVELVLYQQRSREVFGRRDIRVGRGPAKEVSFDTGRIPYGCCAFRATFIDRHGHAFETEVLYDRSPGPVPWLGSAEGVSRRVPRPWTPLQSHRTPDGLRVACWGRQYAFDRVSFVQGIDAAGRGLLAGPIRPVARVNGKAVRWRRGALDLVAQGRDQVVFTQELTSAQGVSVAARTEVDFDGTVRIDWGIASDRVVRLDELTLEVPVRAGHARYFYYFPGRWGEARNVGALPRQGLTLGFRPFVWLGDEERGLSCFAESEKNRHVKDPKQMTEVRRQKDAVLLRVKLVDVPIKLIRGRRSGRAFTGYGEDRTPFTPGGVVTDWLRYTVGVQATPVKPVEADAWDHRILCIGQTTPGFRPRLGVSEALLDELAQKGVRAVVLFEHWADAEGHTRTPHGAALRKIVRACHRRGLKVLLYFGFLISDIAPEWRDFGKDCVILPKGGYPLYHYQPQPEQSAWRVCLNSPWQDFLADGVARVMDEFGVDGVYLDGTEYPFGCCNTEHGCGTVRQDGSVAPSYPLFGVRSAMRRIYEAVRSRRPDGLVNVHNSTCMTTPTLGWATSYWDGEQFQGIGKGVDVGRLLPLDAFRAEFMGRQWGVPAEFLLAGAAYTYEQAWAFTLLHDVPVRPQHPGRDLNLMSRIWKVMDAFDRREAEWLPYWRNEEHVRCAPKGAYVSLYRHPKNGVLAVVSNLGEAEADVRVALDARRLGLKASSLRVVDALRNRSILTPVESIRLRLKPLAWRLLWVRER